MAVLGWGRFLMSEVLQDGLRGEEGLKHRSRDAETLLPEALEETRMISESVHPVLNYVDLHAYRRPPYLHTVAYLNYTQDLRWPQICRELRGCRTPRALDSHKLEGVLPERLPAARSREFSQSSSRRHKLKALEGSTGVPRS